MNDRELLELAAKAAGFQLEYLCDMPHMIIEEWSGDPSLHPEQRAIDWNPLQDDGDALRLAVKLMLSVTIGPCQVQAVSISGALRGEFPKEDAIYQDMGIATRRAITRAAAEIGRGMV